MILKLGGADASFSYLYHPCTCTCGDDGGGGADVEGVVSVAARANDVDDKAFISVIDDGWNGARKDECRGGEKEVFAELDPGNGESCEEGADLLWECGAWCDDVVDGELDVFVGEMLRLFDELCQDELEAGWVKV